MCYGACSANAAAMIFITHYLVLVRSIAGDVVVLRAARVVDKGPADQIPEHPHDPYTASLIEDVPKLSPDGGHQVGTNIPLPTREAGFQGAANSEPPTAGVGRIRL